MKWLFGDRVQMLSAFLPDSVKPRFCTLCLSLQVTAPIKALPVFTTALQNCHTGRCILAVTSVWHLEAVDAHSYVGLLHHLLRWAVTVVWCPKDWSPACGTAPFVAVNGHCSVLS